MADTYGYSIDEERYYGHLPTREAALEEAKREYPEAGVIWTCSGKPLDLAIHTPDADWIIEHIQENCELADVLTAINREDEGRLTEAIRTTVREWLASVHEDQYYMAEDVQEHTIAEAANV